MVQNAFYIHKNKERNGGWWAVLTYIVRGKQARTGRYLRAAANFWPILERKTPSSTPGQTAADT